MSDSAAKTPPKSFRASAESSTTRTLITLRPCSLRLELVEKSSFAPRQQLGRIQQQHDAAGTIQVDDAAHEPRDLVRQIGRRFHGVCRDTQYIRYAVDDQPGAVSVGLDDDEPPSFALLGFGHLETAPLVDDGQHRPAQIYDAFEKFRRLRHPRDLRRNLRDLVDRGDGQREFVASEAEDQEIRLVPRVSVRVATLC
jgi:hypothetical protein